MKNVFLFHGYSGKLMSHWLLWLEEQLKGKGVPVYFPSYENSKDPVMDDWIKAASSDLDKANDDSVFVAHSFGCLVAMAILSNTDIKINKLILVACPGNRMTANMLQGLWARSGQKEREVFTSFIEREIDWQKIKNNVGKVTFHFSENDHAIPFEETLEYYKAIFPQAEYKIYSNHGHFNHKNEIYQMPEILEAITN